MVDTTGNQNTRQQGNSPISDEDMGQILTGLHAMGLDPNEVDRIMGGIKQASERKRAEEPVPEWDSEPPLLSDNEFKFGAGQFTKTVQLKILGGDYYWSYLLPRLEEWVTGLYQGRALELLRDAEQNPIGFMLDVFRSLVKRPGTDRLKISFYEACAHTFSTPEVEITPQFFAKCPPDQQLGSIMRLVETNHVNFTGLWAELPIQLKNEMSLLYLTLIQSISRLNHNVISAMNLTVLEIQSALATNGGAADTGTVDSGPLLVEN